MCHPLFRSTELNSKHSNLFEISTSGEKQNVNEKAASYLPGGPGACVEGEWEKKGKKGGSTQVPANHPALLGWRRGSVGWGSFLNDSHLSQLWSQSTLHFPASCKGQGGERRLGGC